MLDDSARRQLRFSLFLQSFAILMLLVAVGVRLREFGWDAVTGVLLVGIVVVAAAFVFTFRRLKAG